MLDVVGKGNRTREVPLPAELVDELSDYLKARGLSSYIGHPANRGIYLLGKTIEGADERPKRRGRGVGYVDPAEGIAAATLYGELKRFFAACAEARAAEDPKGAEHLARASTHWLRHASHSIPRGTPIEVAQQNLGHASLATTTVYLRSNEGTLVAYGKRRRAGKLISTALAESAVNQVINARMCKRQQMRWTPRGAHLLAQVRCAVINGNLAQRLRAYEAANTEEVAPEVRQFLDLLERAAA